MSGELPNYLVPYLRAASRHGDGFESLLWASRHSQAARFDALARVARFEGAQVLDAGCGRADLLDHLLARGIRPADYVGIEAVAELAEAARRKRHARCRIIQADFIREPQRLFVGADVIVFSGSLNTLAEEDFYRTLRTAFDATAGCVVFNFLSSPLLASAQWLTWHESEQVTAFARELAPRVEMLADYLDGDCTVGVFRDEHA